MQICLEDEYTHKNTRDKLNELIKKEQLQTVLHRGNRWYFPIGLRWSQVESIAKQKRKLIELIKKSPRRFEHEGIVYMDYAEYFVETAMKSAGYVIVSKDAYYFNGVAYRTNAGPGRPRDLDFIAYIPTKNVYVGVQIKNRFESPKRGDIKAFLDICSTLNVKPLLVARIVHPKLFSLIKAAGGAILVFKRYFLQPPFPRDKFYEIQGMGIPLGVYERCPGFLISRFKQLTEAFD